MTAAVATAVAAGHRRLEAALAPLDDRALLEPSHLPGWDRLTIVCHLRYGAEATRAMVEDTVAGRPAAFYPGGRDRQRPATLRPRAGEGPTEVVAGLAEADRALEAVWAELEADRWDRAIREPVDRPDLGSVTLTEGALLRLTEVEVHGTDLGVGFGPWSEALVIEVLPWRLGRLATARSNHRPFDDTVRGTWIVAPHGGRALAVTALDGAVTVGPPPGPPVGERCRIAGPGAELLAFLLGRRELAGLDVSGDRALASRFRAAFPPP